MTFDVQYLATRTAAAMRYTRGKRVHSLENVVAVARTRASYEFWDDRSCASEIGGVTTSAEIALHQLFRTWRLDLERYGTSTWNSLAALIPAGSSIVIKPNWVFHENQRGAGLDCLVTHSSVIEAVVKYVGLTNPAQLIIGDAPIQGCDFGQLRKEAGIDGLADRLRHLGLQFSIVDFRRTIRAGNSIDGHRSEGVRDVKNFVLFDLEKDSLLESLAEDATKFRVTMYNPELLHRTHAAGRHQYLIAKEVIEANVVINLPKLKSHRKSCVTGALKNLVGINGNRKGGSESGGDCYIGRPGWKRATEGWLDAANRRPPGTTQPTFAWVAGTAERIAARLGVGGEGEGPLGNTSVPSGFVTGALNPPAAEWIHAGLMGFDPRKILLIREAFRHFTYPLTDFSPDSIRVWIGDTEKPGAAILPFKGRVFLPPRGWQGRCELTEGGLPTRTECTKPLFIRVTE